MTRKVLSEGGYWSERAESPDYARYREEPEALPDPLPKKRRLNRDERLAKKGREAIKVEREKPVEQRVGRVRFLEDFTEEELKEMEEKYGRK